MSRRGRNTTKFSLFAFQDIITSVTGIMILVTLILALELLQRKEKSPPKRTAQVTEQVLATVAKNNATMERLSEQLKEMQDETAKAAPYDIDRVGRQLEALGKLNDQLDRELNGLEKQRSDVAQAAREAASTETIEELVNKAKEKLEQLQELKDRNRVIFNPAAGQTKTPWLVEIDGKDFKVAKVGELAKPAVFSSFNRFKTWAQARDKRSEYFVLLVKPEGIAAFDGARNALKQSGFDVGYDLLAADQTAIHPETGAAVE